MIVKHSSCVLSIQDKYPNKYDEQGREILRLSGSSSFRHKPEPKKRFCPVGDYVIEQFTKSKETKVPVSSLVNRNECFDYRDTGKCITVAQPVVEYFKVVNGSASEQYQRHKIKQGFEGDFEQYQVEGYVYGEKKIITVARSKYKDVKVKKRREISRLSDRTKSKIKNKIKSWYYTKYYESKGDTQRIKFSFITLTITPKIQGENDANIHAHSMLNYFLTVLRKVYGKFSYLWVAEIQDGKRLKMMLREKEPTNNIHFHLVTDKYFPVKIINKMWLKVLASKGFKAKNNEGKDLVPLDIESIDKPSKLGRYITKYITKNDSDINVPGSLWNCSQSISQIATGMYRNLELDSLPQIFDADLYRVDITEGVSVIFWKGVLPKKVFQLLIPLYQFNSIKLCTKSNNEMKAERLQNLRLCA